MSRTSTDTPEDNRDGTRRARSTSGRERFVTHAGERVVQAFDPSSGKPGVTYPVTTPEAVDRAVEEAASASLRWRREPPRARVRPIRLLGKAIRERREEIALIMTSEMGKPVSQSRAELDKCAWLCDWFADHAPELLEGREQALDEGRAKVVYEPLGAVLAIMPWNFPVWQVVRCAVPALLAGNAVLLKHAPNVPGCAAAIADLMEHAELPEGLFASLMIPRSRVTPLLEDPRIPAVSLTGSVRAGRSVAEQAGHALKKVVLELGGSDPYVVLSDADLDLAAEVCVTARMHNSGQSCIAAKRFIVSADVADAFTERVIARVAALRFGDPRDDETDVGPMARADLRDTLHDQVQRSVAMGAEVALGGRPPEQPGFWYPPTVVTGVRPEMPLFEEETFGPVACVVTAEDDHQALELAGDTDFGLGAAVFTRDVERGERLARHVLHAGTVAVNRQVASDPRLPFGGIKTSGLGREMGVEGLREFTNVKVLRLPG